MPPDPEERCPGCNVKRKDHEPGRYAHEFGAEDSSVPESERPQRADAVHIGDRGNGPPF